MSLSHGKTASDIQTYIQNAYDMHTVTNIQHLLGVKMGREYEAELDDMEHHNLVTCLTFIWSNWEGLASIKGRALQYADRLKSVK